MKALLFPILLLFILNAKAQDCLNPSPGCEAKKADGYLIELAGCTNSIDIYLYDSKARPVRGIALGGKAEFFYMDESCASAELIQYERTNALKAEIPCPGFYNFKVSVYINKDTISTYFDNNCDLRAELKK